MQAVQQGPETEEAGDRVHEQGPGLARQAPEKLF